MNEYELEKKQLTDKHNLEEQFREDELEAELARIETERLRKLESAAIEYARKLEQLATAKQRELEELARWKEREEQELAKWYERELEEIDRNAGNKAERLINNYAAEGRIHEEQQALIHGILVKWFGSNMALVDQLAAYTAMTFANMAAMAAGAMAGIAGAVPAAGGMPAPYWDLATAGGLASGGQFVTTKPTSMMVGEGGEPELVQVTPLSQLNSMRGRQPSNGMDGSDGMSQQKVSIDLNLSPDLEARVVSKALKDTADIITRVRRSK